MKLLWPWSGTNHYVTAETFRASELQIVYIHNPGFSMYNDHDSIKIHTLFDLMNWISASKPNCPTDLDSRLDWKRKRSQCPTFSV